MKHVKNLNKIALLYLIVFPLMTILTVVFYVEFDNKLDEVNQNILQNEIIKVEEFAKNLSKNILDKTGKNVYNVLENDVKLRQYLEEEMAIFISRQYSYIYLIYKDKNNKLRYILDGSKDENQKGEFNQKFDPQNNIWDKVFRETKIQLGTQHDIEELWITYLYPLIVNNQTVAVLAFDFSIKDYQATINNIKPLKDFFLYLTIFMTIMLAISYFQVYLNYVNRKKSIIDPLTLTYNRLYMNEILTEIDLEKYQICMMDIDYFKRVNDIYGHDVGDRVLENISKIVKSQIRNEDIFIRYGGEEFLIFVYKNEKNLSVGVPHRIREKIKNEMMYINGHKISITVSFGVNTDPNYCKNIEEAIKIADEQLYKAKSGGRNKVVSTLNKQLKSESSKKILEVKEALDENRIVCFYQPIFNMKNLCIVKYESLVRMIDKKGKVILPGDFLPAIQNTASYVDLTKKILELSMKVIEEYDVHLSINLAVQDFFNADIIDIINEKLTDKKDIAQKITLEILEQSEITDIEMMKEIIIKLKKLGLKIALDDFGSGYANFSYLLHLPIDIVKIDESLITDIDTNKNALYITKAIIAFGKLMHLEVIAEAVENKKVFDVIKSLDVDCIQGFYLAKPSPVLPIKE